MTSYYGLYRVQTPTEFSYQPTALTRRDHKETAYTIRITHTGYLMMYDAMGLVIVS
jgi:hypothetical protein